MGPSPSASLRAGRTTPCAIRTIVPLALDTGPRPRCEADPILRRAARSCTTRYTHSHGPIAVVRRRTGHGRSTQIARDARRENVHSPCYDDDGQHVWRMALPRTRCSASTSNRTLLTSSEVSSSGISRSDVVQRDGECRRGARPRRACLPVPLSVPLPR